MKNQQSKICNLIIGVALTDYRPVCFDSLLNHLEQYSTSFVSNGKEVLWTKLAASLCILGIYERTVMERALAKEFFHKILKRSSANLYLSVLSHLLLYSFFQSSNQILIRFCVLTKHLEHTSQSLQIFYLHKIK